MMKTTAILLITLFANSVFAQWNYDNQNFIYSNSNALMVGTSTPVAGYGNPPNGKGIELYSATGGTLFTMKSGNYSLQLLNSPIYGCNFYLPNNVPFSFNMNGVSNPALRIQTNGNIGINTTYNNANYKLAVGGKIIAEELKVQLQAQWPDYVFSKYYNLPTLAEVEKQIQEKGHLSNMPSAEEVNCEGFEVGELTRLQQEKIEELTLYIIELNKKLEEQEKRLKALESKNQQ